MKSTQSNRAIASTEKLYSQVNQPTLTNLEIEKQETQALETQGLNLEIIGIQKSDRWSIYRRLQELEISCSCAIETPLQAQIGTPTAALQLWSIARRYRDSRHQLLDFLEDCWQIKN